MLIVGATFCLWLSLYFYVPFLPLRAIELGASNTMLGVVVAAYAIAQVGLRIPVGVGADILGRRKPFAVAALAAATIGALGLALSPTPWMLFLARAVTGIAAAGWVAITVLHAAYYPGDQVARAMSRIMMVNAVAVVLASFVGGLLAEAMGTVSTFYASAVIAGIGTLLLLLATEPPIQERQRYTVQAFLDVARRPLLLLICGVSILLQFVSFSTIFGFTPVYAERIGASEAQVGYVTTAMFAGAVLGTALSPRLAARLGYARPLLGGALVMAVATLAVPWITDATVLVASQAVNGIGRGLTQAVLITLTVLAVAPPQRATAMGVYQALYAVGMLSGPVVSGLVADAVGINAVFYLCTVVACLGGALVFARRLPTAAAEG